MDRRNILIISPYLGCPMKRGKTRKNHQVSSCRILDGMAPSCPSHFLVPCPPGAELCSTCWKHWDFLSWSFISPGIHGTGVHTHIWLNFIIGKYTSPMDPMGFANWHYKLLYGSVLCIPKWFLQWCGAEVEFYLKKSASDFHPHFHIRLQTTKVLKASIVTRVAWSYPILGHLPSHLNPHHDIPKQPRWHHPRCVFQQIAQALQRQVPLFGPKLMLSSRDLCPTTYPLNYL